MAEEAQIKDAFNFFDIDKSGCIDQKEFENVLVKINEYLEADKKISDADIKNLSAEFIKQADKNKDGKVSWAEFYAFVAPALKK